MWPQCLFSIALFSTTRWLIFFSSCCQSWYLIEDVEEKMKGSEHTGLSGESNRTNVTVLLTKTFSTPGLPTLFFPLLLCDYLWFMLAAAGTIKYSKMTRWTSSKNQYVIRLNLALWYNYCPQMRVVLRGLQLFSKWSDASEYLPLVHGFCSVCTEGLFITQRATPALLCPVNLDSLADFSSKYCSGVEAVKKQVWWYFRVSGAFFWGLKKLKFSDDPENVCITFWQWLVLEYKTTSVIAVIANHLVCIKWELLSRQLKTNNQARQKPQRWEWEQIIRL